MEPLLRGAAATLCASLALLAQPAPQPPCGSDPLPAYPAQEGTPAVRVWNAVDWAPAACTGWTGTPSALIVAAAARFRCPKAEELRRRIGAISQMTGLLYWSATRQKWRPLIIDAYAVAGPNLEQRRKDYAPQEVAAGRALYLRQEDSLLGTATLELKIVSASDDRVVFATENKTAIQVWGVTLFRAGDLQSIAFLNRESKDLWRYYGLARMPKQASVLGMGREAPFINRAVALFRHLAGIPTDQEPPAAR